MKKRLTLTLDEANTQKPKVSFPRETLAKALTLAQAIKDHIRGTWEKREATTSYMDILLKQSEVAEKTEAIVATR